MAVVLWLKGEYRYRLVEHSLSPRVLASLAVFVWLKIDRWLFLRYAILKITSGQF